MKVLGCIIAGGRSSRMGRDKAFIEWRGKPLIEHVAERLGPQVTRLVINANGNARRFSLPVIADLIASSTPLAGLHAALTYATENKFDAVLSVPCDTPLLPLDLYSRLQGDRAAIAYSCGQAHFLTGLWPIDSLPHLDGLSRVQDFAAATHARRVEWTTGEHDPFFNVNTPSDLSQLPQAIDMGRSQPV